MTFERDSRSFIPKMPHKWRNRAYSLTHYYMTYFIIYRQSRCPTNGTLCINGLIMTPTPCRLQSPLPLVSPKIINVLYSGFARFVLLLHASCLFCHVHLLKCSRPTNVPRIPKRGCTTYQLADNTYEHLCTYVLPVVACCHL